MKQFEIITLKLNSKSLINYAYIVYDTYTKEGFLVDPAWDSNLIQKEIDEHGIKIKFILLTHYHHDHTGLSNYFTNKYQIKAYIHKKESSKLVLDNLIMFEDYMVVQLSNKNCYMISTPGHTVGSTCYLFEDFLFTGDTLFNEGCGICDLDDGGNPYEMYKSLQLILRIIPDHIGVFSGHCFSEYQQGLTLEFIKKINIYLNIFDEESFVKFRQRPETPYSYY